MMLWRARAVSAPVDLALQALNRAEDRTKPVANHCKVTLNKTVVCRVHLDH
jgi:hypothetical protein